MSMTPHSGPAPTLAPHPAVGGSSRMSVWMGRIIPYGLLLALGLLIVTAGLPREAIGALALFMMLVLMFLKIPLFVALALPGLLALWGVSGLRAMEYALKSNAWGTVATWELSVLPMFIFMGLLLWQSGLTESVYRVGRQWLGWMPGGLAAGTMMAGTGLAAVSGSSLGTVYALGRIGIPEMLRNGYDRRLATGSVLMASLPGGLIPPSIGLLIYAGITEVPVGPQLLAGVGPGILISVLMVIAIVAIGILRPDFVGRDHGQPATSWRERIASLGGIWPLPVLIAVVLGGMFTGVLTATEAGAAGALGALIVLAISQRKSGALFTKMGNAIQSTLISVGSIFLLIVGAHILASMLSITGLGSAFTDLVVGMDLSRVQFLLLMFVAYLILGMFMDPLSIMLLTVPLLLPSLIALDVSLLWYGVFAVFMGEMAVITPPVGILSFIVHGIAKDPQVNLGQKIELKDVFMSAVWFMPMVVTFVLALIFFPEISTWLVDRAAVR